MALMTPQAVTVGLTGTSIGLTGTFTTPTTSDTLPGGDNVFLYVKVGGTATTITLVRQVPSNFGDLVNIVSTSLTSVDKLIGPLNAAQGLIAPATGLVTVLYNQVTAVTSAAFVF